MEISLKQLKNLIATLEEGGVSEIEYEDEKLKLRLVLGRGAAVSAMVSSPRPLSVDVAPGPAPPAPAAVDDPSVIVVTSPFVGTFYSAPGPDSPPFVEVGASVKKGQTLCIVEAMKLMNEIEAEEAGTLLEVLVENGQSVEFGQKLFKLKGAS